MNPGQVAHTAGCGHLTRPSSASSARRQVGDRDRDRFRVRVGVGSHKDCRHEPLGDIAGKTLLAI